MGSIKMCAAGSVHQAWLKILKKREQKKSQLMIEIEKLERKHKQSFNSTDKINLKNKQMELQTVLDKESLWLRDKNRAQWYQYGNKTGKILAKTLKDQQSLTSIVKILKTNGDLTYDPIEISKTYHTYYSKLYAFKTYQENKENDEDREGINKYMEETALPRFPKETIEDLEKEISTEEIQQAIAELVQGKSPGPDGYTARFYKKFQDLIIPILKKTYYSISNTQMFAPQSPYHINSKARERSHIM